MKKKDENKGLSFNKEFRCKQKKGTHESIVSAFICMVELWGIEPQTS